MQTLWPARPESSFRSALDSAGSLAPDLADDESAAPCRARDGIGVSLFGRGAQAASIAMDPGSGVMGLVQRLVGALLGSGAEALRERGPQRHAADLDFGAVGDPHLSERGTLAGGGSIDKRFDSMSAHDDLLHARDAAGGYRVSTAVTAPDANGVTWNRSATVHANGGADRVTMRKDGTVSVVDAGRTVALGRGQSLTLSGGETVSEAQDGSLTVTASDARGGTIATTLRATGNGVDVTAHAHAIAVGGDIVRR